MPKFLEQFVDTDMKLDHDWKPEQFEAVQRERLTRHCAMVAHALEVPRRLGGDASPAELSADKTTLKRALGRYRMFLGQWGGQPADYEELMQHDTATQQAGAQLDTAAYWEAETELLRAALRSCASHAWKLSYVKQGNAFCNRLINEYNVLDDIFGDPTA